MSEVKPTLKRMAVYYLLLVLNSILFAALIPDRFPLRTGSEIYLLALSVALVLYYAHRVSPAGRVSRMTKLLSWMCLLLILLRGIKYSVFPEVGVLARHTWYLYYVPILLLPLFLFSIALFVAQKDQNRTLWIWYASLAVTVVLIALILTNDLHQQAFAFQENFADWDSSYTHGWLFYAANVWQFLLFFAAIVILLVKCRISSAKKSAWVLLIPVAIGTVLYLLLLTGTMPRLNGTSFIEFPETHVFTTAVILECCMQLGLIPTNTDYGRLFRSLPIAAQITDKTGVLVYASSTAAPLTKDQFALDSGSRIGEHTVLHKMPIPGGYGFWQDDLTELDRLNDELADAKEGLAQEADLIRLRNELLERQTKIRQRTQVYDSIAKATQKQSQAISQLAEQARLSDDPAEKDALRRHIVLLGAYIKRYANLALLSQEGESIEAGELGLSVSEVLRYLNYAGIPGEFIGQASGAMPAGAALAVFETFETLLETNRPNLSGVFVNLSSADGGFDFKVVFEDLAKTVPDDVSDRLSAVGVRCEQEREDNVTYVCFAIPEGGAT